MPTHMWRRGRALRGCRPGDPWGWIIASTLYAAGSARAVEGLGRYIENIKGLAGCQASMTSPLVIEAEADPLFRRCATGTPHLTGFRRTHGKPRSQRGREGGPALTAARRISL